ncbi:unnamed protein product, partial [Rotaria sp. Silwood2]
GHMLIKRWYRQWDGTVQSLNRKSRNGRPRTLSKEEVKHYKLDFVKIMNSQYKSVNYRMVKSHVETSLNRTEPLSNIQRYGKKNVALNAEKLMN